MRAWFAAPVEAFVSTEPGAVGDALRAKHQATFAQLTTQQVLSWEDTVPRLQRVLRDVCSQTPTAKRWTVVLEYELSRLGKRIDCVLLAESFIAVLEFKRGPSSSASAAARQAEDYAFALRHFHEGSHGCRVLPLAVGDFDEASRQADSDDRACTYSWSDLADYLVELTRTSPRVAEIPAEGWLFASYRATPTILEAARALFSTQTVYGLSLASASQEELAGTTSAVLEQVSRARRERLHTVVFVTGVPGAGKTLVGLNVVQEVRSTLADVRDPSVLLSGNGPLVEILREALLRDARTQARAAGRHVVSSSTKAQIFSFIQEMHRFTSDNSPRSAPPPEHVVIFDEAQRAWTREKCDKYANKRGAVPLGKSEPATILSIMARHDWAVLVCLVGPGQEIHAGEGGMGCWHEALEAAPQWTIVGSEHFRSSAKHDHASRIEISERLHLATSRRSLLAEQVTSWVDAVLDGDAERAFEIATQMSKIPFAVCRSADRLRSALRSKTLGRQRTGVLASSGALRLRPAGFEPPAYAFTRNVVSSVEWFLREAPDVQSSNQLEVAMSEFESQGLELDYTGVCWGGDLVFSPSESAWRAARYSASHQWEEIPVEAPAASYVRNKYRVLLTRGRLSAVIMVPQAERLDPTQRADDMDATYDFLLRCGVLPLPG